MLSGRACVFLPSLQSLQLLSRSALAFGRFRCSLAGDFFASFSFCLSLKSVVDLLASFGLGLQPSGMVTLSLLCFRLGLLSRLGPILLIAGTIPGVPSVVAE